MTAVSTRHRSIWEPWAADSRGPKASMMPSALLGPRVANLGAGTGRQDEGEQSTPARAKQNVVHVPSVPSAARVPLMLVEAVGIEPTSGNPQPQASTSIAGLSYCALALRPSIRQEDRGASLICLAPPLRRRLEPATRV